MFVQQMSRSDQTFEGAISHRCTLGRARTDLRGIACVAFVLALPATAGAQCVIYDKPEDLFARADVVFVGTAVATEPTHAQGDHGTFRVEQAWKGRVEREMRVGADRLFELNTKYVVFAAGKPLSTSIPCKWTEPVDRAKAKLDWLGKRPALRRGRSGNSNTEILRVFLRREAP
jgi:hypothetical protein